MRFTGVPRLAATLVAAALAGGGLLLAAPNGAHAASTIVRDGSLGAGPTTALSAAGSVTKGAITYNRIAIPDSYGQRAGTNVFHSFGSFSIGSGDAATFTISAPTSNVISRVTGGQISQINGLIGLDASGSAGSRPNFFLINPAGVSFGAGAAIDVPAAFHVSTANYLKFPDGNFYADTAHTSTFSMAAPEAFGFLGGSAARVSFNNRDAGGAATADALQFDLATGSRFSVVAGTAEFENVYINVPGGDVRILANGAGAAELALSATPATPLGGPLSLNNAHLNIDGSGGGAIALSGGNVTLANSVVSATVSGMTSPADPTISLQADRLLIDQNTSVKTGTISFGNAGNVSVNATTLVDIRNGGTISSQTLDPDVSFMAFGNAGNITIRTPALRIDSGTGATGSTGVFSSSVFASGNAGNISIQSSGQVDVLHQAMISSASNMSFGNAGSISISAGTLNVDATGTPSNGGGIYTEARGMSYMLPGAFGAAGGAAGNIDVRVGGTANILNGGSISSSSSNGNNAGNILVTASQMKIDGSGAPVVSNTGIFAMAASDTGNAGRITVQVSNGLDVLTRGLISSSQMSSGAAGSVSVSAGQMKIDGSGTTMGTGIVSETSASGNAGDLAIQIVGEAKLLNRALVSANTYRQGRAGTVTFTADSIVLDGASAISSLADSASSGQAGSTTVSANRSISMSNNARISAENMARVDNPGAIAATTLSVSAPVITLKDARITTASTGNVAASNIRITATDRLFLDPSAITTSAVNGSGGSIGVNAKLMWLDNSQITTSVTGATGNGGNISIAADALMMSTGFIQANTVAANAFGGTVTINANTLLPAANTLFVGGSTPYAFRTGIAGFNVIQAAAPTGISGAIAISSPILDISGSLARLNTQMMDASALAPDLCRVGTGSSLTLVGHGGLPSSARDFIRPEIGQR
jgi:filamentous hemagglutinin family protein